MDTTFTTGGQARDGLSAGLTALMIRSKSSNWSQYVSPIQFFVPFLMAEFECNQENDLTTGISRNTLCNTEV